MYADEGTAAHTVAAWCLTQGKEAVDFIGQSVPVFEDDGKTIRRSFTVDFDFAEHVQTYVDAMRRLVGVKLFEQRVDFSEFIGVPNSKGTSDTIAKDAATRTLESHDLKFGKGVKVYAKWLDEQGVEQPNEQLGMYLLGTLSDNDLEEDWQTFVMGVHQPRIGTDGHLDEFRMTRAQLMAFAQSARAAAAEAMSGFVDPSAPVDKLTPLPVAELMKRGMLRPGDKQCTFCPRAEAGTCPALDKVVTETVFNVDEFDAPVNVETVALVDIPPPDKLNIIELYLSGMRSRIQRELQMGRLVKGWKLTKGKKGPRQFVKEKIAEVEGLLKKWKIKADVMYKKTLATPTQLEKSLTDERYAELKKFITQSEGGEHVVAATDPAPAIVKANVSQQLDPDADLID